MRAKSLLGSYLLALAVLIASGPSALWAQATGALTGRVTAADGTPATDAQVRLQDLGRRVAVGESGQFALLDLPPGSFLVEATSPRFGRAVERVVIVAGSTTTISLEMDPLFRLDELVVSAGPLSARRSETYQPSSALTGLELTKAAQSSLGETLAGEPGVTSSYNGPGASRPIIRGLGGDRVRILEGGVGSGDVSNQGPDHAVSLEPLAADRIEVVRGPATLLYGSSAVGGVVNIINKQVPRERPSAPIEGSLTALGGTVSDELTGALELNGAPGGPWAWHLSGLRRSTDDYNIPGFAEHQHDEGGTGEEGDEPEGILENSAVKTTRGAAGLSWIGQSGYLGFSISAFDTDYGVPVHGHGHEEEEDPHQEEEEETGIVIGMEQRKFDLEGSWRFTGDLLQGLKGRLVFADYKHTEFEGEEVGTRFNNKTWEGRLELQHSHAESSNGTVGIQVMGRDFFAEGDEAFVPPSNSVTGAAFFYEEIDRDELRYQVGGRIEGQKMEQTAEGIDKSDLGVSLSAGLNWTPSERAGLSLTVARSVKLPGLEELFSDGPHAATFSYEIGNPELDPETAYSFDSTLRLTEGTFRGEFTAFLNIFNDFIFQAFTGEEEDELPVQVFNQSDATFWGAEAALEFDLIHRGEHHLLVEGWGDMVRAELTDLNQYLPRIPPFRIGGGLRYDGGVLRGDFGVTQVADQTRISPFEEETAGYTMLDASFGYRLFTGGVVHDLVLQTTNLANKEARVHTSYIKELAPLPGREIKLIYRVHF